MEIIFRGRRELAAVADSSFLIALLKGEKWAEDFWEETRKGRRIYVSTVSLAMASMGLWRKGEGGLMDVLIAALKQALNVSIVLLDVKIALEAGRLMHSMRSDLEEGAVIATAFLKDCEIVVTKSEKLAEAARKHGLKVVAPG
ncbi:MAG: type II toxin-antitoxin system VapC family toxin [Candidatus Jordarchaeales archaeon]